MEYFILQDGVKQGPYDLITMIKKVKNGSLGLEAMVSEKAEGPFREASHIEEVAALIHEHAKPTVGAKLTKGDHVSMTLKACFHEGMELWIRHIMDYTLVAGLIMAIGLGLKSLMGNTTTASYIGTVVIMTLFFEFCYYVLETKRSQRAEMRDLMGIVKRTFLPFFGFSLVVSTFVLAYGLGMQAGFIATLVAVVLLTFLAFTPFIATDSGMGVIRAATLSFQRVKSIGGDNFGVVLAIISINLFAAILPGLLQPALLGVGLFISLPVTISALAYIYDQIFI